MLSGHLLIRLSLALGSLMHRVTVLGNKEGKFVPAQAVSVKQSAQLSQKH